MTPVLYSAFRSRDQAAVTFGQLLEMGVLSEDLSLLFYSNDRAGESTLRTRRTVDSGQTHLEELQFGPPRVEVEGLSEVESAIGGGISTSTFDDDVSAIEEMDDAADVAENVAEPVNERYYGEDDIEEAQRLAESGRFDATRPTSPSFSQVPEQHGRQGVERPYSVQVIDGIVIAGDGPLATDVLSTELAHVEADRRGVLEDCISRMGVPRKSAADLLAAIGDEGAILSVAETPGAIRLEEIEKAVEGAGASMTVNYLLSTQWASGT